QRAFASLLQRIKHQLVVAARLVQRQSAACQHLQPLARLELQPAALGPEHRAAHLRARVLEGEVQVPRRRPRHVAQRAFHQHERKGVFQQAAGQGVELGGGEDVACGRDAHGHRIVGVPGTANAPAAGGGPQWRPSTVQTQGIPSMKRQALTIPASLLVLALAACGPAPESAGAAAPAQEATPSADSAAAVPQAEGVVIHEPWLRQPPPSAEVSAGYLLIQNPGTDADRLLSVETDAAERVEVHEMEEVDG